MIEFEFGAQRLPALSGVTLLAGNLKLGAVRAVNRTIKRDVLTERTASGDKTAAE